MASATGSITIKRLRTGATIDFYLRSDKPLQQFVNTDSGEVTPDWTLDENRPVITPYANITAISGAGTTVILQDGAWAFNSTPLSWTSTTSGSYVMDTTDTFGYDSSTGALKIFKNLASSSNFTSDTLTYTCKGIYESAEYSLSASITVNILQSSASSYTAGLTATEQALTEEYPTSDIYPTLAAGSLVPTYYVKFYRGIADDDHYFTDLNVTGTSDHITVDREQVNGGDNNSGDGGGTLFIGQFYLSSTDTSPVASSAIMIADEADEYSLVMSVPDDSAKQLDTGTDVTVHVGLANAQGTVGLVAMSELVLYVLKPDMTVKRTSSTYRDVTTVDFTVTVDDSVDGADVNVVGECTYVIG